MGYLTSVGIDRHLLADEAATEPLAQALGMLLEGAAPPSRPEHGLRIDVDGRPVVRGATTHDTQLAVLCATADDLELVAATRMHGRPSTHHPAGGMDARDAARARRALAEPGDAHRFADDADQRAMHDALADALREGWTRQVLSRHGIAPLWWPDPTPGLVVFGIRPDQLRPQPDGWSVLVRQLRTTAQSPWGPLSVRTAAEERPLDGVQPAAMVSTGHATLVAWGGELHLHQRRRSTDADWDEFVHEQISQDHERD